MTSWNGVGGIDDDHVVALVQREPVAHARHAEAVGDHRHPLCARLLADVPHELLELFGGLVCRLSRLFKRVLCLL